MGNHKDKPSKEQIEQEVKEGKRLPNGHDPKCQCMGCWKIRVGVNLTAAMQMVRDADRRLINIEQRLGLPPRQPQDPKLDLIMKEAHELKRKLAAAEKETADLKAKAAAPAPAEPGEQPKEAGVVGS